MSTKPSENGEIKDATFPVNIPTTPDTPNTEVFPKHSLEIALDVSKSNVSQKSSNHTQPEQLPLADILVDNVKKKSIWDRFKGMLAMLLGTFLLSLNPQIFYYVRNNLKSPYSSSNYLVWSYTIYFVENAMPVVFMMYYDQEAILKPLRGKRKLQILLAVRGMLGSSVLFITWQAIDQFHRPAPVAVINAMAPIFVFINAFCLLGEALGIVPIVNALIALCGVLVMNLKNFGHIDEEAWVGTCLAFLSMYLLASVTVIIRLLKEVHPLVVNLAFGVFGILTNGTISLVTGSFKIIETPEVIGLCFCTATIGSFGNIFFNLALRYEQAGVVSLIRTTEVIFSFILQFVFFGIQPGIYTFIGAMIVLFGVVCITLRKIVMESKENSTIRKYLYFLQY